MDAAYSSNFASDMGRFVLRLPVSSIVLFSWIVSEYDGLGLVKTEHSSPDCVSDGAPERTPCEREGVVSLVFPEQKRRDVLELLKALRNEGMLLDILFERVPSSQGS